FLGVRFTIASGALAVPAAGRVRALGRGGIGVGVILGALVAASFGFQTAGLERTTVSATGFITGLYVVITPLLALVLFRARIGAAVWIAAVVAVVGLGLLSGVDTGSAAGDALVLACAVAQAFQIVLVERFGIRY